MNNVILLKSILFTFLMKDQKNNFIILLFSLYYNFKNIFTILFDNFFRVPI